MVTGIQPKTGGEKMRHHHVIVKLLRVIYITAILAWVILGCVFRVATSTAGIVVLEAIMVTGFGAWIAQNYCEWRWQ